MKMPSAKELETYRARAEIMGPDHHDIDLARRLSGCCDYCDCRHNEQHYFGCATSDGKFQLEPNNQCHHHHHHRARSCRGRGQEIKSRFHLHRQRIIIDRTKCSFPMIQQRIGRQKSSSKVSYSCCLQVDTSGSNEANKIKCKLKLFHFHPQFHQSKLQLLFFAVIIALVPVTTYNTASNSNAFASAFSASSSSLNQFDEIDDVQERADKTIDFTWAPPLLSTATGLFQDQSDVYDQSELGGTIETNIESINGAHYEALVGPTRGSGDGPNSFSSSSPSSSSSPLAPTNALNNPECWDLNDLGQCNVMQSSTESNSMSIITPIVVFESSSLPPSTDPMSSSTDTSSLFDDTHRIITVAPSNGNNDNYFHDKTMSSSSSTSQQQQRQQQQQQSMSSSDSMIPTLAPPTHLHTQRPSTPMSMSTMSSTSKGGTQTTGRNRTATNGEDDDADDDDADDDTNDDDDSNDDDDKDEPEDKISKNKSTNEDDRDDDDEGGDDDDDNLGDSDNGSGDSMPDDNDNEVDKPTGSNSKDRPDDPDAEGGADDPDDGTTASSSSSVVAKDNDIDEKDRDRGKKLANKNKLTTTTTTTTSTTKAPAAQIEVVIHNSGSSSSTDRPIIGDDDRSNYAQNSRPVNVSDIDVNNNNNNNENNRNNNNNDAKTTGAAMVTPTNRPQVTTAATTTTTADDNDRPFISRPILPPSPSVPVAPHSASSGDSKSAAIDRDQQQQQQYSSNVYGGTASNSNFNFDADQSSGQSPFDRTPARTPPPPVEQLATFKPVPVPVPAQAPIASGGSHYNTPYNVGSLNQQNNNDNNNNNREQNSESSNQMMSNAGQQQTDFDSSVNVAGVNTGNVNDYGPTTVNNGNNNNGQVLAQVSPGSNSLANNFQQQRTRDNQRERIAWQSMGGPRRPPLTSGDQLSNSQLPAGINTGRQLQQQQHQQQAGADRTSLLIALVAVALVAFVLVAVLLMVFVRMRTVAGATVTYAPPMGGPFPGHMAVAPASLAGMSVNGQLTKQATHAMLINGPQSGANNHHLVNQHMISTTAATPNPLGRESTTGGGVGGRPGPPVAPKPHRGAPVTTSQAPSAVMNSTTSGASHVALQTGDSTESQTPLLDNGVGPSATESFVCDSSHDLSAHSSPPVIQTVNSQRWGPNSGSSGEPQTDVRLGPTTAVGTTVAGAPQSHYSARARAPQQQQQQPQQQQQQQAIQQSINMNPYAAAANYRQTQTQTQRRPEPDAESYVTTSGDSSSLTSQSIGGGSYPPLSGATAADHHQQQLHNQQQQQQQQQQLALQRQQHMIAHQQNVNQWPHRGPPSSSSSLITQMSPMNAPMNHQSMFRGPAPRPNPHNQASRPWFV